MAKRKFWIGLAIVVLVFATGCESDVEEGEKADNAIFSVSISGDAKVCTTLYASAKNASGYSVDASFQWKRGSSQTGTYTNISGATQSSYAITTEDTDKYLKIEASNASTSSSVSSNALGTIDANQVAKPTVNPADGAVVSGHEITLESTTEGSTIYYTLDGTTPTSNKTVYDSKNKPVITANCTLKAIATKYDMVDSEVLTVTYTIAPSISWTAVPASSIFTTGIQAAAYGNNKFVAAAGTDVMAYSSDGTNWTKVSSASVNTQAITYGGSKFVAVGLQGKIAYSTDGISWTPVESTSFGTTDIHAVTYGNGKYVAVGDNGKIAYSSDGTSWTGISAGVGTGKTQFDTTVSSSINGIAYGSGKFVAVGNGGKMAYSTNGTAWVSIQETTFTSSINGITYGGSSGNQQFIAVGGSFAISGAMASSKDGVTWTTITPSSSSPSAAWGDFNAIAWGDNKFVAVGNAGVMVYSNIAGTSWGKIDGGTGTRKSQFNTGSTSEITDIVYGGGKFLAVGSAVAGSSRAGELAISN